MAELVDRYDNLQTFLEGDRSIATSVSFACGQLIAAGLAPSNNLESGISSTLSPGLYTALLAGRDFGTGISLVEIYDTGSGP